jgi:hypothetical protein
LGLDPFMRDAAAAVGLLKRFDSNLMRRYLVSIRVNLVTNDGPECSAPVDLPAANATLFDLNAIVVTRNPGEDLEESLAPLKICRPPVVRLLGVLNGKHRYQPDAERSQLLDPRGTEPLVAVNCSAPR